MRTTLLIIFLILAACGRDNQQQVESLGSGTIEKQSPVEGEAPPPPPEETVSSEVQQQTLDLTLPADLAQQSGPVAANGKAELLPDFFGASPKAKKTRFSGKVFLDEENPADVAGVKGGQLTIETRID